MSSEKFFENGGRPIDVEHANFLNENVKPETDQPATPLPTPASCPTPKPKPKLTTAFIIPIWIVLSSTVIIYNNYLYNTLNFKISRFPRYVPSWLRGHWNTRLTADNPPPRRCQGCPSYEGHVYAVILPIGLLFSASSHPKQYCVSLSQCRLHPKMLKACRFAFTPVAILIISWTFRIQEPNRKLAVIVFMISSGVALASRGELRFNLIGFLTQAAAVGFEASRLVMIQILLHGLKMDPLVRLCAFFELARVGPLVLLSNAGVAFCLNVAAVFLVGAGSGLVLTLAGVFKDILLITGSVLIFSSPITPLQVFGYSIALGGLILFKTSGGK
ncbi:hypothetical protein EI94DRAFT_1836740 [Lactarius quietus]|nr:hypothetical protein EI94DRAFT_1836740 [Lactarius quietus]